MYAFNGSLENVCTWGSGRGETKLKKNPSKFTTLLAIASETVLEIKVLI